MHFYIFVFDTLLGAENVVQCGITVSAKAYRIDEVAELMAFVGMTFEGTAKKTPKRIFYADAPEPARTARVSG